jgi:hypothetical protein
LSGNDSVASIQRQGRSPLIRRAKQAGGVPARGLRRQERAARESRVLWTLYFSMIFSKNRFPLFGIMLSRNTARLPAPADGSALLIGLQRAKATEETPRDDAMRSLRTLVERPPDAVSRAKRSARCQASPTGEQSRAARPAQRNRERDRKARDHARRRQPAMADRFHQRGPGKPGAIARVRGRRNQNHRALNAK